MRIETLRLSFVAAVATFSMIAAGCSKSAPPTPTPGFDQKKYIGTWIEARDPSAGGSYNVLAEPDDKYRKLEIKDDKTFRLWFVDKDGKPMLEDKYVAGTWTAEGSRVTFNVDDNQFTGEFEEEIPKQITRMNLSGDAPNLQTDQIRVTRGTSGFCWYSRAQ